MAETLNRFAGWYLHRGETQRAINVSSELIDVFQDLVRQGDEAAVLDLARVHHNQATLYQADFAARYSQLSPEDIPEIQRKTLAHLVKTIGLYEQLIRDELYFHFMKQPGINKKINEIASDVQKSRRLPTQGASNLVEGWLSGKS